MKIKSLILGLILGIIYLSGCNDDLNKVGPSIQPDKDKIAVFTDTFRLEASTVLMDAVYARTDTGLLGALVDPLFGDLKSDYICQFYCPENFSFKYEPIDGKIDSAEFYILYDSWVGDSLTPMRAEVYMVDRPLDKYYYTDMDPLDFSDMQTLLGAQTYSAYDMSVPDSIRNNPYSGYTPHVRIRLNDNFGQDFYDETINNPSTFKNQESFNEYIPGFYVTNTFGSGNVLRVKSSFFSIYYKRNVEGSQGQDSTVLTNELFTVTGEVIQLNRFENTDVSHLLEPSDEFTYIKTPAGVCTKIVIPISEMAPMLEGRILNNLPLSFKTMPQDDWQFALAPPKNLLLIPEDSVKTFFEEGKIQDGVTSFMSSDLSNQTYTFGNISTLLKNQLENAPDEDLNMLLIPVNHVSAEYNNGYYSQSYTIKVVNYLAPSGITLRKEDDLTDFVVTSCKYND